MTRPGASAAPVGRAFTVAQAHKAMRTAARDMARRMREERDAEAKEVRTKREEKRKRRAENALKSAQYQVLDPATLKRMSKKQLRHVRRTRVNADGVVELVGAYT
jgi:hypothetical protein